MLQRHEIQVVRRAGHTWAQVAELVRRVGRNGQPRGAIHQGAANRVAGAGPASWRSTEFTAQTGVGVSRTTCGPSQLIRVHCVGRRRPHLFQAQFGLARIRTSADESSSATMWDVPAPAGFRRLAGSVQSLTGRRGARGS